jgi:hypothetical protein
MLIKYKEDVMSDPKYGWNGWKMPISNLKDPDYCEYGCPICRSARNGNPLAKFAQSIEMGLTLGKGCWWGQAREKKYGVKPTESVPTEKK